jgi:hypothetical protein
MMREDSGYNTIEHNYSLIANVQCTYCYVSTVYLHCVRAEQSTAAVRCVLSSIFGISCCIASTQV